MAVTTEATAPRRRTVARRLGIGVLSAATATVLFAPSALAGGYIATYNSLEQCRAEGAAQAAAAGGPANGATYYCEEEKGVPAGVAGCPSTAVPYGCIGNYWNLYLT